MFSLICALLLVVSAFADSKYDHYPKKNHNNGNYPKYGHFNGARGNGFGRMGMRGVLGQRSFMNLRDDGFQGFSGNMGSLQMQGFPGNQGSFMGQHMGPYHGLQRSFMGRNQGFMGGAGMRRFPGAGFSGNLASSMGLGAGVNQMFGLGDDDFMLRGGVAPFNRFRHNSYHHRYPGTYGKKKVS